LVGELLSKSSSNERLPGRLRFFDTSKTKIGRICVTITAKHYSESWKFEYIGLSIESFKKLYMNNFILLLVELTFLFLVRET